MKILFVPSDNNFTSGAFRSMAKLNQILNQEEGIDTLVVLPNSTGDGTMLLDEYGIKYTFINSNNWVIRCDKFDESTLKEWNRQKKQNEKAISEMIKLIQEYKPDIVHINTSYSYVAAEAANLCNVPVVWHLREFLEEDQSRRFVDRRYANKLISHSDRVFTISEALYKKYANTIPNNKLKVIYNGIDTDQFYRADKKIFQNNKIIFTCIGSINYNKGQDVLTKAIGKIRQLGLTNFELRLAGTCSDHMEKVISGIAKEYGIGPNVKFLGRCNNVDEILEQSDIAFMCSKFEAFGRVTVEAMMTGCLVIGANTGGTKELIRDRKTGLLYDQKSVDSLVETISFALENKSKMRRIANAGREFAFQNLSARQNALNIINEYNQVLAQKKVTAVVVTYNRKDMLVQCIDAISKQSYDDFDILVVDNASTDGTKEAVLQLNVPNLKYINTGANIGGAGGFYTGIKAAYENNAKWIWIMDDDVIPAPKALEELMKATRIVKGKASFFASCVKSLDNKAMNTPGVDMKSKNGYPFWYEYLDKGLIKLNAATFVSLLFNHNAVMNCGYPCKDFFIWGDDSEYTKRVYRYYGNAYLVGKSKVVHMREGSAALGIVSETNVNRIKFYYYMVRNTLTYTKAYADENAFKQKVDSFYADIRTIRRSKDPNKKLKIAVIKKGMKDYFKGNYDKAAFENRLDIMYGVPIPFDKKEKNGKRGRGAKDIVLWLPRRVRGFFVCLKNNGIKYTMHRLVYGKKNNQTRRKIGKFLRVE